jgi:diaminopimelate decarboxylase
MDAAAAEPVPVGTLLTIAERFGTPCYAYDLRRIRARVAELRAVLPPLTSLLYSIKANPSLGLCELLAREGLGAETASIGELLIAGKAGFAPDEIMVTGPHKQPALLRLLDDLPDALVSVDSVDELRAIADLRVSARLLLRLRPDYQTRAVVDMGPSGRFGIPFDELDEVRSLLRRPGVEVVGFHVFSGSQILGGQQVAANLRGAFAAAQRAGSVLGLEPSVIGPGGGFGVPYGPGQPALDLLPVAHELAMQRAQAPDVRLLVELGRYLVAPAGYYLTGVLGAQTRRSGAAVVVDGGKHQRTDLCGLDLAQRGWPPVPLTRIGEPTAPTDVLGCLCLPEDVLAEGAALPALKSGDVLAFTNAGAYGFSAAPLRFISHQAPPEVAFDGERIYPLRHRAAPDEVLRDQLALPL